MTERTPEEEERRREAKRKYHREYMREVRRRAGARPGANGPPVSTPCPDPTAYSRHLANGETPCDPCREAWAIYRRIGSKAYRADEKAIRAGLMTRHGLV